MTFCWFQYLSIGPVFKSGCLAWESLYHEQHFGQILNVTTFVNERSEFIYCFYFKVFYTALILNLTFGINIIMTVFLQSASTFVSWYGHFMFMLVDFKCNACIVLHYLR